MDSRYWILDFLSVELGFPSSIISGMPIYWVVFRIPKSRIPDPQSKLSRIPESQQPNPDSPSWGRNLKFPLRFLLTLSLPNMAKGKFRPKFQILFSKILRNKWHHVKVQAESFHLNMVTSYIGFRPSTQKLESPYKTPSNTLAVKGLKGAKNFRMGLLCRLPPVIFH